MAGVNNKPLVSITISSYNSEKMLPLCLEAVSKQSYTNIETLLIDSHSTDRTRDIATSFGVIECDGKLLSARYLGWEKSKGIAFIDTDQVLEAKAIERAVALMDNYDREILEKAFGAIPQELIPEIIFYDHDIIYYMRVTRSRKG
ncbi:glycosyltransferase family 2 protein [Dehalococcoidales bacterium]|nr:glycosyltransferase family 2 protein [Dehalococcoidales bacterium]